MTRFLALILALFATAAVAQTKGTPTFQIDKSGAARCLYAWDLNNTTSTDKGLPFGCIDSKGAWNLPPALRNTKEITETDLRGYGYVGDGSSHPLSGVTSLNGRSTVGWTLGQWQAILPAAGALSDEIDGAVINSLIAGASAPIKITLGPGKAMFSRPIKSCLYNVTLRGSGWDVTTLYFGNNTNAWEHCRGGSDPLSSARIEASDLRIERPTATNTNTAITARFQPGNNVRFNHLQVRGFNSCIATENGAGMTFEYTMCYSLLPGGTAGLGIGLDIQGGPHTDTGTGQAVGGTYINHITNSLMQGYELGYRFYALGAGLEDQRITNSAAGGVRRGIQITGAMTGTAGNYSPFEFSIDNFSCDATTTCLDVDRGWHVIVRGGDFLLAPAIPATTWNGTGADFIRICRANTVNIRDAFISNNAQAIGIGDFIHVRSDNACGLTGPINPLVVQITNNTIEVANLAFTSSVFKADAGSVGILFKDNVFTSAFVPIEPAANSIVWNNTDNNSALFRNVNLGFTAQSNPAAFAITTNVNFNAASLALPPGKWLCQGNIQYLPAGGTTLAVVQGALNTTSVTIPANGVQGGFQEVTNQAAGQGGIFNTGSYAFDLTASSTIYLVGVAQFSGSTSNANGNLQCVRIR